MGCVSYTQRYFRDGKITPARYAQRTPPHAWN